MVTLCVSVSTCLSACLSLCLLGGPVASVFVSPWWSPCLSSCLLGSLLLCTVFCPLARLSVCLFVFVLLFFFFVFFFFFWGGGFVHPARLPLLFLPVCFCLSPMYAFRRTCSSVLQSFLFVCYLIYGRVLVYEGGGGGGELGSFR